MTIDYPSDWSVSEQADVLTFSAPQGASIQLEYLGSGDDLESDSVRVMNVYCSSITNAFGVAVNTCVDTMSFTYTADLAMKSADGSVRRYALSTHTRTPNVFNAMAASVRPE